MVTHDPKAAAYGSRAIHLETGRAHQLTHDRRHVHRQNALRNKRRAALHHSQRGHQLRPARHAPDAATRTDHPARVRAASLRVIVRNKVSLAQPLPAKQLATLERIPASSRSPPSLSLAAISAMKP